MSIRIIRSRVSSRRSERPPHTGVFVAAFRYAASARCGAFVDGRRVVAGLRGGRSVLNKPECPWSQRSPRALRRGTLAGR
jgi:hypothetical protein